MIPADISVTIATKLSTAPEATPADIIGTVIRQKALSFEARRLRAASSIDIGRCINVAVADRIVYGIRRITSMMIITVIVPVSASGGELNAITRPMPITAPGMM